MKDDMETNDIRKPMGLGPRIVLAAFALAACSSSVKLDEPAPVEDRSKTTDSAAGSGLIRPVLAEIASKTPDFEPNAPLGRGARCGR